MDKLPTPDELGEMIAAGKISKGEAVEIMAQRARAEAFSEMQQMMGKAGQPGNGTSQPAHRTGPGLVLLAVVVVVLALGAVVVWLLASLLS